MIDPCMLNHPKVREEAERLAFEHYRLYIKFICGDYAHGWLDSDDHKYAIETMAALLSDPSRPETRDWMIRCLEDARSHDDWRQYADNPRVLTDCFLEVFDAR